MNTRTIDFGKCIGCGLCVSDCINQYLILKDGKAAFKERGRCLECGHCNAICPQRAIIGGKIEPVSNNDDALLWLMANKRTVRHYAKGATIDDNTLEKIIMAGQTAPTDRNRRSTRILMVKGILAMIYNKALDYLVDEVKRSGTINPLYVPTMALDAKRDEVLWNAEYLVVFVGSAASLVDASISAERMQLEASRLGIGTAYRGDMKIAINNNAELREMLNVRKNEEVLLTFAMGRTNTRYFRPAVKCNRKVEYL